MVQHLSSFYIRHLFHHRVCESLKCFFFGGGSFRMFFWRILDCRFAAGNNEVWRSRAAWVCGCFTWRLETCYDTRLFIGKTLQCAQRKEAVLALWVRSSKAQSLRFSPRSLNLSYHYVIYSVEMHWIFEFILDVSPLVSYPWLESIATEHELVSWHWLSSLEAEILRTKMSRWHKRTYTTTIHWIHQVKIYEMIGDVNMGKKHHCHSLRITAAFGWLATEFSAPSSGLAWLAEGKGKGFFVAGETAWHHRCSGQGWQTRRTKRMPQAWSFMRLQKIETMIFEILWNHWCVIVI